MKILIISDFKKYGGAELYCQNLINILLQHNHEVVRIYFDKLLQDSLEAKEYNITKFNSVSKFKQNRHIRNKLNEIADSFEPDIVIVNSAFKAPFDIYKFCKKYIAIQIVHDYGIICPKSTYLCCENECKGMNLGHCIKYCTFKNSKLKLLIKYIQVRRINKLRKKNVNLFISPSHYLGLILEKNFKKVCVINNPVNSSLSAYKDKKEDFILYAGNINDNKGILDFLEYAKDIIIEKNLKVKLIGRINLEKDKNKLNEIINENNNVEYLGLKSHEDTLYLMQKAKYMVIPSKWLENYPTTILEAFMSETVVIGSNRGGIPEMINNNNLIFELSKTSISRVINYLYNMSPNEYMKIVQNNTNYIKQNNSYDIYYDNFMKALRELI